MKKLAQSILPLICAAVPSIVFAQGMLHTVGILFEKISALLLSAIDVMMLAASVVFAWGVIQYFSAAGDERKTKDARKYMMYGVLTLAVMMSAWGLAYLLLDTFSL